jgi:phosphatidylserine/phosphatidylglycerophosphate/cardiolipin synthase-like enzyme
VGATGVFFSPKAGISWKISGLFLAAMEEISIAVFALSSKRLANALVKAASRGVRVRVILDRRNAEKGYSLDEYLIAHGVDVRFICVKGGSMHHKFMVVDRKTLMMGSYNLTNDSEFRNHEAVIFTQDAGLVAAFSSEFEKLWPLAGEGEKA